jgi:Ser/Thr protein kinase RdoA (MazF antagonist)
MRLSALRCYGILEESREEFCWLFLEDAAGTLYSPQSAEHRALAGRWLAEAHLVAAPPGFMERLPRRDLDHYFGLLRYCRDVLSRHLRSALPVEDLAVLRRVAEHLDALEQLWSAIEKICAVMPRTLVHGDFVIKNIRVRDACPALLVFDWEFAGWGLPATDLAQFIDRVASPDLDAYCSMLGHESFDPDLRDIQAVAACGNLLRSLDQISWAISGPEFAAPGKLVKAIAMLQIYEPDLNRALSTFQAGVP